MSVEYVVWERKESIGLVEIEPEYFFENVSREVIDRSKECGLVHLKETRNGEPTVILRDRPQRCQDKIEEVGLEEYLMYRIMGVYSKWG